MYGKVDINYNTVINSLTINEQLIVWSWILNKSVSIGQTFTSPFRYDKTPGCRLRVWNNMVMMGDNKYPEYSKYNCLHGINYFRNTGLNECACFVMVHLHYGTNPILTSTQVITGKTLKGRPSKSDVHFVPFTNELGEACYTQIDANYWQPVGVSANDLKEANIFSCHHFYVNGTYMKPQNYPCYAYVSKETGKVKIYVPYADKDWKWFSTQSKNEVFKVGSSTKLLITKSIKDVLTLKNILTDWEIWSFSNEGVIPSVSIDNKVEVKYLYDNDNAGYKAAERLVEHFGKGEAVFFNEELGKDAYDTAIKHGIDILKQELKRMKLL